MSAIIGVAIFIIILYWLGCIAKGLAIGRTARGEFRIKHECYGEKYCAICGKKLKKPRN